MIDTLQIELPKSAFMCPSGWEWEGDWEMSKVLQAFAQGKASDAFNYKEVNLQWTKILNPSNSYF